MFGSWRIVVAVVFGAALLVGFVIFGLGTGEYSASGGSYGTELVPVEPTSEVNEVSVDPEIRDIPARDRPPESTMSFRGQSVNSAGEILGIWEPQGWLATKNSGSARNRSDGYLMLSSGDLLEAPGGSELTFRYGGELEWSYFFDALAFGVDDKSLFYGEDIGTLEVWTDSKEAPRPVVLPVKQPETIDGKKVRVTVDLPPGVYVVSIAASVTEGDVRYNFRVRVR